MPALGPGIVALATLFVVLAVVPVISGLYQFIAVTFSVFHTNLPKTGMGTPRTAVIIPAWNEAAVIESSIDRLMRLDYPEDSLKVYVVDDASTDLTPRICIRKSQEYPGRVVHIRRVAGGEGKAHTLNYGLDILWRSDWAEAVLIMDADVIYTEDSLRKMVRHLSDPSVGAITANIKEGSKRPNYVQRFITFEYITATGCSRRAQNVFGFLACLSGGAQLHSRENMMAIGAQIFSDTLAEDTFTTFRTQLKGRQARFEPNAIVYAEEPDSLVGLWKQRLRWGRGNVQITQVFRDLWFNRRRHPSMGSLSMSFIWFSIFLMPVFQITAALSLVTLYFIDPGFSWALFRGFWIIAALTYLLVTGIALVVDPESSAPSWREGIAFPGLISLSVIAYSLWPPIASVFESLLPRYLGSWVYSTLTLFLYSWLALGMLVAYIAKELENSRFGWMSPMLLYLSGYGAFLCAVTMASYIREFQSAEMVWDKTEKTGKMSG